CLVAGTGKHEQFASFVERNLRDQMRGVAEPINAEALPVARFAIRPITDQSGAKQRRDLNIIVTIRQMKTVSRVGDGELCITTINCVAGEARVIAEIFSTRSAIGAFAVRPAKPRNPYAISNRKFRVFVTDLFNSRDNLVTQN